MKYAAFILLIVITFFLVFSALADSQRVVGDEIGGGILLDAGILDNGDYVMVSVGNFGKNDFFYRVYHFDGSEKVTVLSSDHFLFPPSETIVNFDDGSTVHITGNWALPTIYPNGEIKHYQFNLLSDETYLPVIQDDN